MLYELSANEVGIINIIRNMNPYDKITIQRNTDNDKIEFKVHYDQSVFFKRKESEILKEINLVIVEVPPIDILQKKV